VSTRSVDDLLKAMGMTGISRSQVSRLCAEIDERVKVFLDRPIEGSWPYLWIDATYVKMRESGRIVSVALTMAIGVNSDMEVGPSEAEPFWTRFLRSLTRRGLRGRQARHLGCPRRPEGGGRQGVVLDLAALPRALHEECARPRRSLAASDGGGSHPHRRNSVLQASQDFPVILARCETSTARRLPTDCLGT
jgi:putative transposase